jgi:hypothetical protein
MTDQPDRRDESDRISATRRITAPAGALFAIVANPQGHVDLDGSGMLRTAPDARPLTAVGETFDMHMDREPLGDIPGMGEYDVRNTVTQIIPDRLLEWTIGSVERGPLGHVYGWSFEPVSDTETEVTNYCDWTNISDKMRAMRAWPVVPVSMLEQSVANLERLATGTT